MPGNLAHVFYVRNHLLTRGNIWLCFVGIFSLAYYLWFYNYGLNLSDEGYLVYGARRVLSGQIPGADFHAYMPGRYLILAFFFNLFGENIIVERLMWVIVRVVIAMLFFRLCARLLPPVIALVPTFLIILIPGPWHKGFELLFPLFWLVSVHFYLTKPRNSRVLLLGFLSGTTFFFRLETGLITLFLSCATLGINRLVMSRPSAQPAMKQLGSRWRILSHDIVIFISSFILILLPYLAFLWRQSGILKSLLFYAHEVVAGLGGSNPFLLPILSIAQLLVPPCRVGPGDLLPYFLGCFVLVYLITFGYLTFIFLRRKWGPNEVFICILTTYGCAQLYQTISQPDTSHLLQAGPFTYLLGCFLLYKVYGNIFKAETVHRPISYLKRTSAILFLGGGLALPVLFLLGILGGQKDFYFTGSFKLRHNNMIRLASDRAGVFVEPEVGADILGILNYIKTNSDPDEGLLTMIYLPMFNFLAERENPLFYDIFFPHHVGSAANQKSIIDNMRQKRPKLIITTLGLVAPAESGLAEKRFRNYGKRLLEFVEHHYHIVKKYGPFAILQSNQRQ